MPLPSLYPANENPRGWRLTRAAAYGACMGLAAALFKILGPAGERIWDQARVLELAEATFAFALLCLGAALLRNMLARWFVKRA